MGYLSIRPRGDDVDVDIGGSATFDPRDWVHTLTPKQIARVQEILSERQRRAFSQLARGSIDRFGGTVESAKAVTCRTFTFKCVCDTEVHRVFIGDVRTEPQRGVWCYLPLEAALEAEANDGRLVLVCSDSTRSSTKCGAILFFRHVRRPGGDLFGSYTHVWQQTYDQAPFLNHPRLTYR